MDEVPEKIVIRKGDEEYVLTERRIRELTSEFIEELGREAKLREDFGMNAKMVKLLIDIKKAWFPATQKSLHASVDFDKSLEKWYILQQNLLDKDGESNDKEEDEVIEYEIVDQ